MIADMELKGLLVLPLQTLLTLLRHSKMFKQPQMFTL